MIANTSSISWYSAEASDEGDSIIVSNISIGGGIIASATISREIICRRLMCFWEKGVYSFEISVKIALASVNIAIIIDWFRIFVVSCVTISALVPTKVLIKKLLLVTDEKFKLPHSVIDCPSPIVSIPDTIKNNCMQMATASAIRRAFKQVAVSLLVFLMLS